MGRDNLARDCPGTIELLSPSSSVLRVLVGAEELSFLLHPYTPSVHRLQSPRNLQALFDMDRVRMSGLPQVLVSCRLHRGSIVHFPSDIGPAPRLAMAGMADYSMHHGVLLDLVRNLLDVVADRSVAVGL